MAEITPEEKAALENAKAALPAGYAIVKEDQLHTLVEERATMLKGILSIGPIFGTLAPTGEMDLGTLIAGLQPLLQDKDRLAVELAPLAAIIHKYSKPQA